MSCSTEQSHVNEISAHHVCTSENITFTLATYSSPLRSVPRGSIFKLYRKCFHKRLYGIYAI